MNRTKRLSLLLAGLLLVAQGLLSDGPVLHAAPETERAERTTERATERATDEAARRDRRTGEASRLRDRGLRNLVLDRKLRTQSGERDADLEVWRSRNISRLFTRARIGLLAGLAAESPRYGDKMALTRTNDSLIKSTGPSDDRVDLVRRGRAAWLQLATDRSLRRMTVRNIVRDLRERGTQLEQLIDKKVAAGDRVVYDDIVIGAGPNGVIIANQILEKDPSRRVLVIDGSDMIASTFAEIGSSIAINSSSRAEDSERAQPFGAGNNNPLPGSPVGVPDIDGNVKWPEAAALADATTFSAAASGADFLLSNRVTSVADIEGRVGARGRASIKVVGRDGKEREIETVNLIATVGLGKPALKFKLPAAQRRYDSLVVSERAKLARGETPALFYYQDALKLANDAFIGDANQGDPFAPFRVPYRTDKQGRLVPDNRKTPRIAIIGSGDSGKTLANLYFGTGPAAATDSPGKLAQSQLGQIGDVDWVVGDAYRDCREYIDSVRARYSQSSADIKAGRILLFESRVVDIKKLTTGKVELVYEFRARPKADGERVPDRYTEFEGFLVPTAEVEGPRGLRELGVKGYEIRGTGDDRRLVFETAKTYDRVIVAAGFDSTAAPLYAGVTGRADARVTDTDVFENVISDIPGLGSDRAIARQVKGKPAFKIAGPSAGTDLIEVGTISGIEQNKVGLKVWAQRGRVLGGLLAESPRAKDAFDSSEVDFRTRKEVSFEASRRPSRAVVERPADLWRNQDARLPLETGSDISLHLAHELGTILDRYRPTGLAAGDELKIEVTRAPTGFRIEIPGLTEGAVKEIAKAMSANLALVALFELNIGERTFAGTARRHSKLTFEVPVIKGTKAGEVRFDLLALPTSFRLAR